MDPLEDDNTLFLADVLLDECKEAQRKQSAGASKRGSEKFVWVEEDKERNPLPKRRRTGEGRKRGSSTVTSGSIDPSLCAPSTSGQQSVTETIQDIGLPHPRSTRPFGAC